MFVNHQTYNIPESIGSLQIRPLYWRDFKGTPPQNTWFLAHIYWDISYEFNNEPKGTQPRVRTSVRVQPRSWVNSQDIKLLTHEYGHYLIGCLCALSFQKKVNYELRKDENLNFNEWCRQILQKCLKQYCQKQKQYDVDTYHYLNEDEQLKWQASLRKEFLQFYAFFSKMKAVNMKNLQKKQVIPNINLVKLVKKEINRPQIVQSNQKKEIHKRSFLQSQIRLYKKIEEMPDVLPRNYLESKNQLRSRAQTKPK